MNRPHDRLPVRGEDVSRAAPSSSSFQENPRTGFNRSLRPWANTTREEHRYYSRLTAPYPKVLAVHHPPEWRLAEIELGDDVPWAIADESDPDRYDGDRVSTISDRAYCALVIAAERLKGRLRFVEALVRNLARGVAA